MAARKVEDSQITMTELVLPHHTNQLGTLFGGQLMYWIDICASLSAEKHTGKVCVTASVDKIDFHHPVKLGDAVTLLSSVNRVFNTSLEVGVKVFAQSFKEGTTKHTNSAYLTFVCVDAEGKPIKAIEALPETNEQKRRFNEALIRRENRLKNRSIEK
ncbi:MAG: acyl-CoA thioesterase [Ignavibacteriaceae bacterium]|nr:acyl-CoA thioesterase [Ignavibacteriaceae bacterium]